MIAQRAIPASFSRPPPPTKGCAKTREWEGVFQYSIFWGTRGTGIPSSAVSMYAWLLLRARRAAESGGIIFEMIQRPGDKNRVKAFQVEIFFFSSSRSFWI